MSLNRREVMKAAAWLVLGGAGGAWWMRGRELQCADAMTTDAAESVSVQGMATVDPLQGIQLSDAVVEILPDGQAALDILRQRYGAPDAAQSGPWLAALKTDIEADFAAGRVQQVGDWYLSDTELQVLAAAWAMHGEALLSAAEDELPWHTAAEARIVDLIDWGPRRTHRGIKFNEQSDGHCGLWFLANNVPQGLKIYIDGRERRLVASEQGFTSGIYDHVEAFLEQTGDHQIQLYDAINHKKQTLGVFQVMPLPEFHRYADGRVSSVFSDVLDWGPKRAELGQSFNTQPSGESAFWVKITCISKRAHLEFNGHRLPTTVQFDLVTARIEQHKLPEKSGRYPLRLIDAAAAEALIVGHMVISD